MNADIRKEFISKINENNLLEHQAIIEKAVSNIGIVPSENDIQKIIKVVNNEIKEKNIKSFKEVFSRHPNIFEIINGEIEENKGIKIDSLTKKIKKQFNEKAVKGILKIVGKVQRNNEIVLTGKLRENFNNEAEDWAR